MVFMQMFCGKKMFVKYFGELMLFAMFKNFS